MEELRNALTIQEQEILANFWEDKDTLHVLQKALLQRQYLLSINTMSAAPDWANVLENRGKVTEDKFFNQFLEYNYKKRLEARKANNNDKSA